MHAMSHVARTRQRILKDNERLAKAAAAAKADGHDDELPELREEVDQLVAGQVWIQARTLKIGPSRPTNSAATVLRNAERCIRRELGMHERSDKTRRRSILIGAGSDCEDKTGMLLGLPSPTLPAEVELRDL